MIPQKDLSVLQFWNFVGQMTRDNGLYAVVQPRTGSVICGRCCRRGGGSRGVFWGLQPRTVALGLIEVTEHAVVVIEGVGDDDLDVPVH